MKRLGSFFASKSTRLASAYLAIIMALSLVLSFAFYNISKPVFEEDTPQAIEKRTEAEVKQDSSSELQQQRPNSAEVLPSKLAGVRSAFQIRLIIFNIAVAIGGGALSIYLARRTLRPIELSAEAQSRFASDASHELRTPLAGLRVRNEVALRKPNLTLAEAKEVIKDDTAQIIRLEELVGGLLRLSSSNKTAARERISLQEMANEAMNLSVRTALAKRIGIEERVPNVTVRGDASSIIQAIAILLDNAIKYSGTQAQIYLEGNTKGKHAYLHVRDEGQGISPRDLPHIFERFYRADHSRSKPGYGLGLALAQTLIAQNKGVITAHSTYGKGATITIKLPLA